jgi:hypothetical protein
MGYIIFIGIVKYVNEIPVLIYAQFFSSGVAKGGGTLQNRSDEKIKYNKKFGGGGGGEGQVR